MVNDVDSVTVEMQSNSVTVTKARTFFDGEIAKYYQFSNRIHSIAGILKITTFNCANVTVQGGR